ncbi:MAG: hypothetical protein WCH39_17360 [Schlesneria sp.]
MQRYILPLMMIAFLAGPLQTISFAGIPIIYGHGEKVERIGDLPDGAREAMRKELGQEVSVGFLYRHAHVYHIDFWTWDGKHVLFNGDRYWKMDDGEWLMLLSDIPSKKFGKPYAYRFPLGLTILFVIIAMCVLQPIISPSDEQTFAKVVKDPRYLAAAESVLPNDHLSLSTHIDDQRLESAIASLKDQGISEEKARKNLILLLLGVCAYRSSQINEALGTIHLTESNPANEGIAYLERLRDAISDTDPRRELVEQSLRIARDKAKASSASSEEDVVKQDLST